MRTRVNAFEQKDACTSSHLRRRVTLHRLHSFIIRRPTFIQKVAMADEEVELMASASGAVVETAKDDADDVKATPVGSIGNTVGGTWSDKYNRWKQQRYKLPRHYKLEAEENVRKYSIWSVNFMITASAINTKMLNPNFAIMCVPGAHPDSFPDTEPL